MPKLEWDINAANFALSESDAYVDAINIYRILLSKGYINLKLKTVEEFLLSNGRLAYPSRCNFNPDITFDNQKNQIPHQLTPYNIPTSRASNINYYTTCNHQQAQKQPQTFSDDNIQNGLVNPYSGPNARNSYNVSPNYYIQNSQQVQNVNNQATKREKHVSDISSHNQIINQTKQITYTNFGTQVANIHQKDMHLPKVQYYSQEALPETNTNCNIYHSTQAGPAVPKNYFHPYNNLSTCPILPANNHQNYPNSHNTNNINQTFHPTYYSNGSNIQTNITNNSGFCSIGKGWDSQADKFVMKSFLKYIVEIWARLKQDGYYIETDDVLASFYYQGLLPKKKWMELRICKD